MIAWALCIAGAYLLGAIPFGVLIARAGGINILEHGSRNIGATNVGRVLGRKFGLACFGLDAAKGAAAVLVAGQITGILGVPLADIAPRDLWLWMAIVVAAVVGHMFSIFIGFRGGKGVATAFGALVAMWPVLTIPAVGALIIWLLTLRLSRYVSLASMCGAVAMPALFLVVAMISSDGGLATLAGRASAPFVVTAGLASFVVYKHRANIDRLRRGEEPKIGRRGTA